MTKKTVRVFIGDARLSYPALDEPKPAMAGSDDLKYQATFLLDPANPTVETVKKAIWEVACAAWGDRAQAMLQHPDKSPLRRGDDKEKVPDGYHGMLYINARSKNRPELRDANPINLVISQEEVRQKFVAGYRVNAFVDIYAYEVRGGNGSVIKSGIAAGLVSVQFKAYADPFSGSARPDVSAYPDCTQDAAASAQYAPAAQPQPTAAPAVYPPAGYGAPAAAATAQPTAAPAGYPPAQPAAAPAGYGAPAQPAQGNNYGGVFDEDPPF